MTKNQQPAARRSLYDTTGNIADINTVLIEKTELDALHTEVSALRAGYDASRLEIESLRAPLATPQAAPQQEAQEPVAWKHDCAALLTNDVELWIATCPHCGKPRTAPQHSPASQGDALSDAVRVPLDSLHADAAYLIGRLREGSMPYARVIEIIRERIDAAKAAIRARAAQGDALDAARYRWLREHRSIDLHANPSIPWVVRCEFQPIPTTTAIVGEALDAAIDAARAAQEGKS